VNPSKETLDVEVRSLQNCGEYGLGTVKLSVARAKP
jgi:hypothetical protein